MLHLGSYINLLIIVVACLHIYFLILEMFLWTKPIGLKTFAMSKDKALLTSALAANQGLYNGFLAAGLVWGVVHSDRQFGVQLMVFFLTCVIMAAAYGAYSVNRKILLIQGGPAILALILIFLAKFS